VCYRKSGAVAATPGAVRLGRVLSSKATGINLLERMSGSDRLSIGSKLDVDGDGRQSEVGWKAALG